MVLIRHARKEDVSDLQRLNDEVFVDNQRYDPDIRLDWAQSEEGKAYFTSLLNSQDSCCLVAEVDGRLVGYIAASPKEINYRKSRYLEIENMGVIPDCRSQGIGALMIEKLSEWAKTKGFQKYYVNSYFKNTRAVAFYKKNGFSEIDVILDRKI